MKNKTFEFESRKDNFTCYILDEIKGLPHLHNHVEFMYVISGKTNLTIGNNTKCLLTGDVAIVFPNQIHCGQVLEKCQILFFIFTPEFLPLLKSTLNTQVLLQPVVNITKLSELAKDAIAKVLTLQQMFPNDSSDFNRQVQYTGILFIILGDIFDKGMLIEYSNDKNTNMYQTILEYVDTNCSKEISLKQMSRDLGINMYYISRIFTHDFNISFTDYITQKRLLLASSLLLETDMNITSVMYESGFKSERTFYRSFKLFFNKTPLEYKRSNL